MNTALHPTKPLLGAEFPVAMALAAATLSVYLFASYEGTLSFKNQLLALFTANLALLPAILYFSRPRDSDFPILVMLSAWYSLSLGWCALSVDLNWFGIEQDGITKAYWIGISSLGALYVGFYLTPQITRIRLYGAVFRLKNPTDFLYVAGITMVTTSILMSFIPGFRGGSIEQVRVAFSTCGLVMCWLYYFKPEATLERRRIILAVTSMVFLIQAMSASIKPLIIPIIAIAMTYWRVRRKMPLKLMVIVVLIYVTLNPVKQIWRAKVGFKSSQSVTMVENMTALQEAFAEYYFSDNVAEIQAKTLTINRVADIGILAKVVRWTPDFVPYWNGESLKALPYSLIPRFLWRSKPRTQLANEFGRRYEFIGALNYNTLVSTAWITDLYVNFGMIGAVLGMGLIGYLIRLLQDSLCTRQVNDLYFAVGLTAAGQLYNGGENMALIWGAVPLKLIILIITLNLLYWNYCRTPQKLPLAAGARN